MLKSGIFFQQDKEYAQLNQPYGPKKGLESVINFRNKDIYRLPRLPSQEVSPILYPYFLLTTTVAHTVPVSFENYSCNENSLDIVILERRVTERRISNFTLSPNKGSVEI